MPGCYMPVLACADISLLNLALSFSRDFKQINHAWLPLKGEGDDCWMWKGDICRVWSKVSLQRDRMWIYHLNSLYSRELDTKSPHAHRWCWTSRFGLLNNDVSSALLHCRGVKSVFQPAQDNGWCIPGKWVQQRETHPQIQEMFNFYSCLIYSILSAKIRS